MTIQWHYTPARPSPVWRARPIPHVCARCELYVRPAPPAPGRVLLPTTHRPHPRLAAGLASGAMPPADTDSNDPIDLTRRLLMM